MEAEHVPAGRLRPWAGPGRQQAGVSGQHGACRRRRPGSRVTS